MIRSLRALMVLLERSLGSISPNHWKLQKDRKSLTEGDSVFFDRTDIVMKKMVTDPSEKGKCVPTKYNLGTVRMLYWRFKAETRAVCSLEWFKQNIPFNVVCPKPNNLGTCLCATCINPEIKLNASANFTKNPSLLWDERKSYDSIDCLISHIMAVDGEQRTILHNEWQKLEVTRNGRVRKALQRKTKVSRKVPVQESLSQLKKKLVKELLFAERSPYQNSLAVQCIQGS